MTITVKNKWPLLLACSCLLASVLLAQPPKKPAAAPAAHTAVKLQPKFGPFGANSTVFATDFKQLLNAELKITDSISGLQWQVIKFRLGWRRRDVSDDIRTGKKKIVFLYNAVEVFDKTRMPEAWQKEMATGLQATEEISFESIIAKHPTTGSLRELPTLIIKLK